MTINNLTDRTDLTDLDGDGGDFIGVDKTPILNNTVLSLNNSFEQLLDNPISNDIAIIKTEKFDVDMMTYLISTPDILTQLEKKRLQKMCKNRIKGNCFEAYYKLGKQAEGTIGRWTVKNGVGLQGLRRDIRNALMKNIYWDLDISNAQVEILLQESEKNGWQCESLKEYCINRETKFEEFQLENEIFNRSYMKLEFIRLLFGGIPSPNTPTWIKDKFYPEVKKIMTNISSKYESLYKKVRKMKTNNVVGSVCALFLQTEERKCLMALDNFLEKNGRYMGVLIHDGGGIEKLPNETKFPDDLIKGAEEYIYNSTNYKLSLVIKPIESTFEIPDKRTLDINKTYPYIKVEFENSHFKCIKNGFYYEITDKSIQIRTRTDLLNSYEHFVYEELDDKGFVQDFHFISRWIKDKDIRHYKDVNLYPPPIICPTDHFNLWTGHEIQNFNLNNFSDIDLPWYEKSDDDFNLILKHIKFLFGDECYEYVEKWLALLIQKPGLKPRTCILLNSREGLGKGTLFQILQKIFGKKYCLCTNQIERDIFGDFNSILNGVIFLVLDEMDISISSKYQNKIKDIITNDDITINQKGLKQMQTNNFLHIFGFSNGDFPWKISESDRRCVPIDRIDVEIPDSNYFKNLYNSLENKFSIRKLFDYFMNIDISKFDPSNRPKTQFTHELKLISLSIEKRFIIDFIEKNNSNCRISNLELYESFLTFNPGYSINTIKFNLRIQKLYIDGFEKYRTNTQRGWKIDIQKAKDWCLKNNYFNNFNDDNFEDDDVIVETKTNVVNGLDDTDDENDKFQQLLNDD